MKQFLLLSIPFLLSFVLIGNYTGSIIDDTPVNDSPCMTDEHPPYDPGTNGSHTGTTCGATGYNDDPDADIPNVECSGITDDNAVWYRASYNPDFDGININITAGTIGNNVSVEVFVGDTNAICDNTAIFRKSKCDNLPVENMHIGCLEQGDYIWIKVTSSDDKF